ncbi:MAG TPA: FlgD immunoglobulin-like domain containing protein [Myxococcaceae bacterium]|nr:FlgD immunoglobulin-like domain containing protein [Myxococcaceae bacterium]
MPLTVNSTPASTTPPSTASTQGPSQLGQQDFLKLLMAQLSNQDPTAPADSQAFVAQLAQFAQVESLTTMSSQLNTMVVAQASANQLSTAALVGKQVAYSSNTVHLVSGQTTTVNASLSGNASSVSAVIKDGSGRTVRTVRVGASASGPISIPWDGRDDAGNALGDGDYTVSVVASDSAGKPVTVSTSGSGLVSGVSFADGVPELLVNGGKVKLADVTEIRQPTP